MMVEREREKAKEKKNEKKAVLVNMEGEAAFEIFRPSDWSNHHRPYMSVQI
jgi:hypothetical protein